MRDITMRFNFGRGARRRELEELRVRIAAIEAEIEELELSIGATVEEGPTPAYRSVRELRESMAHDELSEKRSELDKLRTRAEELEVQIAEHPTDRFTVSASPAEAPVEIATPDEAAPHTRAIIEPPMETRGVSPVAPVSELEAPAAEEPTEVAVAVAPPPHAARSRVPLLAALGAVVILATLGAVLFAIRALAPSPPPPERTVGSSAVVPSSTEVPAASGPVEIAPFINRPAVEQGETFFEREVEFQYADGRVTLSGSASPTGHFSVDDGMMLTVRRPDGSSSTWRREFNGDCAGNEPIPPEDVTNLFARGANRVLVQLFDVCGGPRALQDQSCWRRGPEQMRRKGATR